MDPCQIELWGVVFKKDVCGVARKADVGVAEWQDVSVGGGTLLVGLKPFSNGDLVGGTGVERKRPANYAVHNEVFQGGGIAGSRFSSRQLKARMSAESTWLELDDVVVKTCLPVSVIKRTQVMLMGAHDHFVTTGERNWVSPPDLPSSIFPGVTTLKKRSCWPPSPDAWASLWSYLSWRTVQWV